MSQQAPAYSPEEQEFNPQPEMKVSKINRSAPAKYSEFLDPSEIPLDVNTVKKPLKINIFRVIFRIFSINFFILYFLFGAAFHFIWHIRNKEKRIEKNGKLFAKIFKMLGGAFTKIGQQMSLRRDILPPAYCEELEGLLDNAKPFSFAYTKKCLEKLTNKNFDDIFCEFKEDPIGKASIACVYRARLVSGDEVAVKVKRPKIDTIFSSDIAALSTILKFMEYLTILKKGVSYNLRNEIKEMFTEELNFNIERRYQELFRDFMKKNKRFHVTAPKIYFGLASDSIIVSEFLSDGIFMSDYMKLCPDAKEEVIDRLNLNPKKVAKRLIQLNHFSFYELPFFHGDPHPGNVYVRPNNKIVLVDFGSCGAFGEKEKNQMKLMQYYYGNGDVSGMTQCVVSLMEPLPPIDVHSYTKELESEWWHGYYGIISKQAHWTEKTSFRLWSALFRISRKHDVPVPLHMLRMVRATLAYDTVAAGLYPQMNVFKEYQIYFNRYAEKVKCEMNEAFIRQMFLGPDPANYVRLQQLISVGDESLFKIKQLIRQPIPNFESITDKVYDFIRNVIYYFIAVAFVLAVGGGVILMTTRVDYHHLDEIVITSLSKDLIIDGEVKDLSELNIAAPTDSELSEGITEEKTPKKHLDENSMKRIKKIAQIEAIIIAFLTLLYGRKILVRFEDRDNRT